jgi:hypothetical protein
LNLSLSEEVRVRTVVGRLFAVLVVAWLASGCTPTRSTIRSHAAAGERPDILLISIDTLRADYVSAYGHEPATTPFVDGIAEEGVRFSRAYSTSSWTVPSLVSMLTSSYPSRHGMGQSAGRASKTWSVIPDDLPSLAASLERHGYRTYGLTANFSLPVERGFGKVPSTWRSFARPSRPGSRSLPKANPGSSGSTSSTRTLPTWHDRSCPTSGRNPGYATRGSTG